MQLKKKRYYRRTFSPSHLTSNQNFRNLWYDENTRGLHVSVHCSIMSTEVIETFPFVKLISTN